MQQFTPIKISDAFIVTPWSNLVTRAQPYMGAGDAKYTAKLMFSIKSEAFQTMQQKQNFHMNNDTLFKSSPFFTYLDSIQEKDHLQEERQLWIDKGLNPKEWVVCKVTRNKGEHDLYSPKNEKLPKDQKIAYLFSRGHKINFSGVLSVAMKRPVITIYAIQYVGKGFSEELRASVGESSPFAPIPNADDPFMNMNIHQLTDDGFVPIDEDNPVF